MAFSPDGKLASGSWDGTARLWNTETRKQIATLPQGDSDTHVPSVAFSADGKILAAASLDVGLWNVATKQRVASLQGKQPYSVAFSPDGKLASGLWDGPIELWDVGTKRQVATLRGHPFWVRSVSFSQDGTLLASGAREGTIRLWDVMAREQISTLKGHRLAVNSVALSPDGTRLASGSDDRTVKLWDVATRQSIATLEGHTYWVEAVSFLSDGTLVSGDARGTIRLWNVATQEPLADFGHGGGVHSVALSPDGTMLASGARDGTIRLWDVSEWRGSRPHTVVEISGDEQQESRPHTLDKVSGDGQEGLSGVALAEPFVVSVLDQNGSAFAGAVVRFSVAAGGGTLSSTTATTDANGRARSTLTLGSEPGTNTVTATVEGLEPVTFTATGQPATDSDGEEEDGEIADDEGQQDPEGTPTTTVEFEGISVSHDSIRENDEQATVITVTVTLDKAATADEQITLEIVSPTQGKTAKRHEDFDATLPETLTIAKSQRTGQRSLP